MCLKTGALRSRATSSITRADAAFALLVDAPRHRSYENAAGPASRNSGKADEEVAHRAERDQRNRDRRRHPQSGLGDDAHVDAEPERGHGERRQYGGGLRDRQKQHRRDQAERADDQHDEEADDEPRNQFVQAWRAIVGRAVGGAGAQSALSRAAESRRA